MMTGLKLWAITVRENSAILIEKKSLDLFRLRGILT